MNLNILHPIRSRERSAPTFSGTPLHFESEHVIYLKEFGRVRLRPIRPDDEPRLAVFHATLSEENLYFRYFDHASLEARTRHDRLTRICTNTAESLGIVAEQDATASHPARILAVGRLTTTDRQDTAAFAMLIGDDFQKTGLACELLKRLLAVARAHRFHGLMGEFLVSDHDALNLCRNFGFQLQTIPEDGIVQVDCAL